MSSNKLYSLVVPCKGTIEEKSVDIFNERSVFYFNKKSNVRLEPNGTVVISPGMMIDFFYFNKKFNKIFTNKSFDLFGYPKDDVNLLIKNKIISKRPGKRNEKLDRKFSKVGVDGLPVQALLDITSACNCDCLSCYHKDDLDGFYPELKDIKKRIDKLKDLGILIIEVTGGEPFLRSDLSEILDYIKYKGLLFYIVTNAEFLKDADTTLIKSLKNANGLAVSLDGYGKIHDKMRRRPGLFKKILRGLDLCFSNNIPVVLVSTLNEENISSVPKMLRLANKYNFILHLRPTIVTGAALTNNFKKHYPVEKIRKFLEKDGVRNGFLGEKRNLLAPCGYYGCGLRRRISIDVYGNIFPCVMDRSRNIGNVSKFTPDLLFKELVKESLYFLKQHKDCIKCDKLVRHKKDPICSGFCRFSKSYKNNLI